MPSSTAAASTNVLNVEPGWRRACATRLNWLPVRPGVTAAIARIAPFAGLIETTRGRRVVAQVERVGDRPARGRLQAGLIVV